VPWFLLGSFAEGLVGHSRVPLLIANPRSPVPPRIRVILFATDFSRNSVQAFKALLPRAAALAAKVVIYSKCEYVLPETEAAMQFVREYQDYLHGDIQRRRKAADEWQKAGRAAGVRVDLVLDEKPMHIVEGVLKCAKKTKADILGVVCHSGPVAAVFLGSISRQLIRAADRPVWVMHA